MREKNVNSALNFRRVTHFWLCLLETQVRLNRLCDVIKDTKHCTLYTVFCTLYSVHCTLSNVHWPLYIVHCTLYTVYCTLSTVHCPLSAPPPGDRQPDGGGAVGRGAEDLGGPGSPREERQAGDERLQHWGQRRRHRQGEEEVCYHVNCRNMLILEPFGQYIIMRVIICTD